MADLSTTYLGLKLKNPIIAGSSGLTNNIKNLKELEKNGAGAIVLKSLFEEEIRAELDKDFDAMNKESYLYPETLDYYDNYTTEDALTNYLKLISDAKKELNIPIIASVNCVTADKWPYYTKTLQDAGADAIELNVFVMPSDFNRTGEEHEKVYFDIVNEVKKYITIPFALKISYYHSNLGAFLHKLSASGVNGLVMFNRFYSPDFDVDNMEVVASNVLSTNEEITTSLRWVSIMANRVECDIASSTGVHNGTGVIKQLLAGANAVQVASTLYKNGFGRIQEMLIGMEMWMNKNGYTSIDDFRGKMSQSKSQNPAAYERVQFMKYFGKYEHQE